MALRQMIKMTDKMATIWWNALTSNNFLLSQWISSNFRHASSLSIYLKSFKFIFLWIKFSKWPTKLRQFDENFLTFFIFNRFCSNFMHEPLSWISWLSSKLGFLSTHGFQDAGKNGLTSMKFFTCNNFFLVHISCIHHSHRCLWRVWGRAFCDPQFWRWPTKWPFFHEILFFFVGPCVSVRQFILRGGRIYLQIPPICISLK